MSARRPARGSGVIPQATLPGLEPARPAREEIAPGAVLLRGRALAEQETLWRAVCGVIEAAPLRNMVTPGGRVMSAAMTNCGALGWVTDGRGYRYEPRDPTTNAPWPAMPATIRALATRAALEVGFVGFDPDACLVNRYAPGARMTLHQDRDERDFTQPIVSVSLGLPITFLFGGDARADRPLRVPLEHGDVLVWGGPARLRFHGVAPLADGVHPLTGAARVNLTLRRAG